MTRPSEAVAVAALLAFFVFTGLVHDAAARAAVAHGNGDKTVRKLGSYGFGFLKSGRDESSG